MSSGIDWKYTVSNSNPAEPPIRYDVGVAWASGAQNELVVGCLSGLDSVRTAYAHLPGLGYYRNEWLRAPLSGAAKIAEDASKYLVSIAARKVGKESPLIHGGYNVDTMTVGKWLDSNGFVCGREIAEYAGVALDATFIGNWEALAIAAEEYPRHRWGVCPKVRSLKVETWGLNPREVTRDEAARVLDAAEAWGRAVDTRTAYTEADVSIANLLDEDVVKAAIAVTLKKGSVSGLRHALRVSGYLEG
jgi:hypothetical protein